MARLRHPRPKTARFIATSWAGYSFSVAGVPYGIRTRVAAVKAPRPPATLCRWGR